MMDLMDVSNEIQETLGRSYNVPDDIDEDELMGGKWRIWLGPCLHFIIFSGDQTPSPQFYFLLSQSHLNNHFLLFLVFGETELDALELDMGNETEADGVPSYLQPDKEPDLEAELNLPPAPTGQTAVPPGRSNAQV